MRYFDRSARLRRRALRQLALTILCSVLAAGALVLVEFRVSFQFQGASPASCGTVAGASGSSMT